MCAVVPGSRTPDLSAAGLLLFARRRFLSPEADLRCLHGCGTLMAGEVQMLASTADRDRAISVLKASFLEGRLTKDELVLRVGDVLTARLFTDVMALTCDLPVGLFGRLPAHPATPAPPRASRLAVAAVLLGWLGVLASVLIALHVV